MCRAVFVGLIVLGLAGCIVNGASAPEPYLPRSGEAAGAVFGSIGWGGRTVFTNQSLRFRAVGSEDRGYFNSANPALDDSVPDFKTTNGTGIVFFTRLRPGDYEIFDFWFQINRGSLGTTEFSSEKEFSVPFTVRPGEAVYLGEFLAHPVIGRTLIGIPAAAGAYFVVSDRFERDAAILKAKPQVLNELAPTKAVVDPDRVRLPVFQRSIIPDKVK